MRPNLSQFVLLVVLIAIPIVQFAVRWKTRGDEPVVAASSIDETPVTAASERLPPETPAATWAASAMETADLITELGRRGRISEAMKITRHALALPRHPTLNNPYGRSHATLALDRMLNIFLAWELWDDAITFCTAPDAVGIGDAMVESLRLRLLGIAFANKRQLTFRSRILTRQLQTAREKLDWRQGIDEHHNDICQPSELVEIDYAGNDAARAHIEDSAQIIEAHRLGLRGEHDAALRILTEARTSPLVLARAFARSGRFEPAIEAAREFAASSEFPTISKMAVAELLNAAGQTEDARSAAAELHQLAAACPAESPLWKRLLAFGFERYRSTDSSSSANRKPHLDTEKLAREFPLRVKAPAFRLPGVQNQTHALSDYQGRPVLIVFYLGDGCLHCARQLKRLAPSLEEFEAAGITVLGISSDPPEVLAESLANYRGRIPFPLAADPEQRVFDAYRLARPESPNGPLHGTFLIDAAGDLVWRDAGDEPFMDIDFLLEESQRLVRDTPKKDRTAESPFLRDADVRPTASARDPKPQRPVAPY